MRIAHWMMTATLACAPVCAAWAIDGEGLTLRSDAAPWARWHGRLSINTATPAFQHEGWGHRGHGLKLASASLLGDYYFAGSLWGLAQSGGFRATSGLFLGSRAASLLSPSPVNGFARAFSVHRRSIGSVGSSESVVAADTGTTPYLGVGYTGLSSKSGWGFSADIGLMALHPGSAVKLGRVVGGTQSLEDLLRDMRLSPLVHLGVSYSF